VPRNDLNIPPQVLESIRAHVERAINHAETGYSSAQESEDAVTGELGGALRTDEDQLVTVADWQPSGAWRWNITYSKFGSSALDSTESVVGADGILEIRVGAAELDRQKTALFQAKNTLRHHPNLVAQSAKMSVWREASFVISYSERGYKAYSLDDILLARGSIARAKKGIRLGPWIVDTFIGCRVGHTELYYDKNSRRLYWTREPLFENEPWDDRQVWVDFLPKHLFHVDIVPPNWRWRDATELDLDKISLSRLTFKAEELFGIETPFTFAQLRKRRKELLSAYHSDTSHHLDDSLKSLLDRRFVEINEAYSKLHHHAISETRPTKTKASAQRKPPAILREPNIPTADEFVKRKQPKRVKIRRR
jgi:hypothetical protein